jgi:transaldolase/glucose-6-phosphate isomerase
VTSHLLSNTQVDAFSIAPGSLTDQYTQATARLERVGFSQALWQRRLDVWTNDDEVRKKIANRLGWLGAADFVEPLLPRLTAFAASVRADGVTDVVLLGMGGSSLAPEVMRQVLGVAGGFPRFRMLDSTDPDAVRRALDAAATSLFIIASKSGTTIEPNVMAAEAQRRVIAAGHAQPGSRFVAITDEGTALHRRALAEGFRDVFVNPSDIGGRYSALTLFGMVPAALMGVDLARLLRFVREMEAACRSESVAANPGLALGTLMASGALNGRDKLTLLLPERLRAFGLWVEQLVAESTGKQGKGIVPIAGEPSPLAYGHDRVAVTVELPDDRVSTADLENVESAQLPVARLQMSEVAALGAEFFRWEVATATAGLLLDINPFDEPNVQQAKDATRALLDVYVQQHRLPVPEAVASVDGARLTLSRAAENARPGEPATAFLKQIGVGDYFCLLAYVPPDDATLAAPLAELRDVVGDEWTCATMFGYGPRYLHSTGQLHKGGANNGVFIVITADPAEDLAIPDQPFSFGVLEQAQGLGDFQSLDKTDRRALHIHLSRRDPAVLRAVTTALLEGAR